MATLTQIFDSLVDSGEYDYDLKHRPKAEMSRMKTRFVDAVLADKAVYAGLVDACWENGAKNELRNFLINETANKVATVECVHYCNFNIMDQSVSGSQHIRATEACAQVGLGVVQLIIARIYALFDDLLALYRTKNNIEVNDHAA